MKRSRLLLCIALSLGAFTGSRLPAQIPGFPIEITQEPQTSPDDIQQTLTAAQDPSSSNTAPDPKPTPKDKAALPDSPPPKIQQLNTDEGQQTKRILWIIPNYRSVSANTELPPQSFKEKLWLATQDSFDYSGFIWSGMIAGISMAGRSDPSFGHGMGGYGIYYAHSLADNTIENYFVEALVPAATKEDPRYYTLGHGGVFKRTGYAMSRLLVTRTDSGHNTFNISEVVGAGAAAGLSNAYYPDRSNMFVKTYQLWGSQMLQDGLSNILKEFWPDVNRAFFHNKY